MPDMMEMDNPGWSEWLKAVSHGKTHLNFADWKESNAKAVKLAKKRVEAAKKRKTAKSKAESEESPYPPATQVNDGQYDGPRLYGRFTMASTAEDNPDHDGYMATFEGC